MPSSAVVTPTPWLRYGISTCRAESTRENARSSGLSVPVTYTGMPCSWLVSVGNGLASAVTGTMATTARASAIL